MGKFRSLIVPENPNAAGLKRFRRHTRVIAKPASRGRVDSVRRDLGESAAGGGVAGLGVDLRAKPITMAVLSEKTRVVPDRPA